VVRIKRGGRAALVAAATRACAQQTQVAGCERVLVVYGAHEASLYIESKSSPSPRRAASS
jgi:hypothetical protein